MNKHIAVGIAALLASMGAQAAISVTAGKLNDSFITLSSSNVSGGAIYAEGENHPGYAARPTNNDPVITTVGNWLAAGPGNNNNSSTLPATAQPAVLSFAPATITAVSFLWGSPDTYNSFEFTLNGSMTSGYTAAELVAALPEANRFPLNQVQTSAYYITLSAGAGEYFTALKFASPQQDAIEISNVSITAVPEPEAYGLALAGMGIVALSLRRRRNA